MTNEYITFLAHMRGDSGDTRLLAGTRSRLYCNTGLDGNWRLLYKCPYVEDYTGVPEVRWRHAQMGNIVIFTNGSDSPVWWSYEQEPDAATGQSAQLVDDLVALDISLVKTVASWRGFVFLGNVVTEGNIYQNRIYWSDFNDPLSFTPLPDSLAGYIDLGSDERVLAMAPLGGQFRVYTDKAIYDANLVGGEEVFNFREIYRGPQVLRFENSLVSTGDTHIYGGEDTLYALGEFDRDPKRLDWLYKASGAIYNGVSADLLGGIPTQSFGSYGPVNRSRCWSFVGGFDEAERTLWYSWPSDNEIVPTKSLAMQIEIGKACIVDSGFTAFCSHLPSYQASVRMFLSDIGACQPLPLIGEGNPIPYSYVQDTSLQYIRNSTENPSLPVADSSSLCDKMNDNPSLEPDCSPCGNGFKFVMASAVDKCLKEYDAKFASREFCSTPEENRYGLTWTSTSHPTTSVDYTEVGYVSILQTDAQDMGSPANKTVLRFAVEYDAPDVPDTNQARLFAFVGYGAQPRSIIWQDSQPRPIDRLSPVTESEMAYRNIRPNRFATFPFFRTGSQIAYRLVIADEAKGPVTGGMLSLNEMNITIRTSHGDYV